MRTYESDTRDDRHRLAKVHLGEARVVDQFIGSRSARTPPVDAEKLQARDDGSVDIYFGPEPPAGLQSNWIPTGQPFFLIFRFYGPEKPLFEKTWRLPDVERVN